MIASPPPDAPPTGGRPPRRQRAAPRFSLPPLPRTRDTVAAPSTIPGTSASIRSLNPGSAGLGGEEARNPTAQNIMNCTASAAFRRPPPEALVAEVGASSTARGAGAGERASSPSSCKTSASRDDGAPGKSRRSPRADEHPHLDTGAGRISPSSDRRSPPAMTPGSARTRIHKARLVPCPGHRRPRLRGNAIYERVWRA